MILTTITIILILIVITTIVMVITCPPVHPANGAASH